MATTEKHLESIEERLDLVIRLLALLIDPKKLPTISEQINLLADRGLAQSEIGRVVGRKANYVSAVLKNGRRMKRSAN
jgi:hypothetical protein